jgi:hypothetical protein
VSESSEKAASVAKARSVVKQCRPLNTLRVRRKLTVKFRIFQSCRLSFLFGAFLHSRQGVPACTLRCTKSWFLEKEIMDSTGP